MSRKVIFLVLTSIICITTAFSQEKFRIKKDLSENWTVFREGSFENASAGGLDVQGSVHLELNANEFLKDFLLIESRKPFFLFVNGKLVKRDTGKLSLGIDSLSRTAGSRHLFLTLYQKKIDRDDLKTAIMTQATEVQTAQTRKPPTQFRDFVILSGLLLMVFFVAMRRLQPKLASDYLSVAKIISVREGEDTQTHARFALSSNVWFYVFCSMLLAMFLMIVFYHLPDKYLLTAGFRKDSFGLICWQWMKISAVILIILFARIIVIFALSNLFGLRGIAGLHFFNGIRLLLTVTSALSVIGFIYYISRGTDPGIYTVFLTVLIFILALYILLVFLKLNGKSEHSVFHLFSYICATEVIPLLITAKVLFQ